MAKILILRNDFLLVNHTIRLLMVIIMLYTIMISAWLTDDAFISFRHVWNFINGDGITVNFGERVQGFSHPLWFLLLSLITFITNELFLTSIIVSLILSLFAFLFLLLLDYRLNRDRLNPLTPLMFLLFSYAYCDFTSSGLENPLSHFLLGLLILVATIEKPHKYRSQVFFIMALLVLTRFDFILLVFPLAIFFIISNFTLNKKEIITLFFDVLPSIILVMFWIIFSIVYFGFPLQNTFYAKLSSGFPIEGYIIRGFYYFLELKYDPASMIIILSAIISTFIYRQPILVSLCVGNILYLLYILYVGGDFMRGRFFSINIYLSVAQLIIVFSSEYFGSRQKKYSFILIFVCILISSLWDFRFPFTSSVDYKGRIRLSTDSVLGLGIQDERGFFYNKYGLFSPERTWPNVNDQSNSKPEDYGILCGHMGSVSLSGKSSFLDRTYGDVHLIDVCALTDPFLSKIPAIEDKYWRIGHNIRKIPTDYGDFLIGKITELPDKHLRKLSNDIFLVTRGSLFTIERLKAIWRLNTNFYADVNFQNYIDPSIWVPKTTKIKTVYIENWNEEVSEYYLPNLNIFSNTPSLSIGMSISLNPSFVYNIIVNDELVAKNISSKVSKYKFIEFNRAIDVNSIKIRTVGLSGINESQRWWIFNYNDRINFLSLKML